MRCSPRPADPLRHAAARARRAWRGRLLTLLLSLAALFAVAPARADEILVTRAALESADEGHFLSADFEFELSSRLEDALSKGVPLFFLVEFEATRPRWYWFDERAATASQTWRLSFHALTRTYRLSSGALTQSFPTLSEALRTLSRVRSWLVADRGQLKSDTRYVAGVRMRLDTAQLPKPFQVSALANRDWTLASNWYRWDINTPAEPPRTSPAEPPRPPPPEPPR
jgi:hypothetical protein